MERLEISRTNDTIAAISTPSGVGGIAVVRVSGPQAYNIVNSAWKGKRLADAVSHTVHLGKYCATDGSLLDEAVATIYRAPASFTGEDVVELSVHGSRWIQREIIADLIRRGARVAEPGEFTRRAFLNGKLDLAQAEGVADLIESSSRAAHSIAVSQTRGAYSREFDSLRLKLTEFASLLELELDFSEEDVEFADRSRLTALARTILAKLERLAASYSSGAVIKDGVPVVIAGVPNAGKSSVLNLLLGDDKAIVSDIPGTTRDTIEDTIELDGVLFRFTDTAGLRETHDKVEELGIQRARKRIRDARIIIWVIDPTASADQQKSQFDALDICSPDLRLIVLANKTDLVLNKEFADDFLRHTAAAQNSAQATGSTEIINFSAATGEGLGKLKKTLTDMALAGFNPDTDTILSNARHYEAVVHGSAALRAALNGLESGLSADFVAQDIREALHHLSLITGAITSDTLLHSIFSRFCVGK